MKVPKILTSFILKIFFSFYCFLIFFNSNSFAACTGTIETWGGATSTWNTAANWSPANVPNTNVEDVAISSGNVTENLTTSVGCITVTTPGIFTGSTAVTLTYQGDSFTSNTAGALTTFTGLTVKMGPHLTAANAQTFTFNQATTMKALTVASTSVPGAGLFGATITNLNAGTAIFTTLANTGLNSSKYVGNITATTYTNTKANSVDVNAGTFKVNSLTAANTVTGGSLNVNSGGTFITTTTFNPVAGFTTTVDYGAPMGILTVTTTSAPAGIQNIDGTMTTTQFNATATSTTTVSSTGTITATTSSTPLGAINIAGTFTTPLFNPAGTSNTTINSGGLVSATTSSTPGATSILSIAGTLTTPIFNPVSGASITVNSGGNLNATISSTPAASITIASGGTATIGTYSPTSTSTTNVNGHMIVTTFTPAAGSTINVNNGGILDVTTFTPNATTVITVAAGGTLNITTMTGTLAATVNNSGTITVTNLPSLSTGTLNVMSVGKLIFTNGVTLNGATLKVQASGILEIADTKTITLTNGSFQILGTSDTFPQNIATKGIVQAPAAGQSFNFTTTGGTLSLTGFNFDRLGVNGLNIGGTTIVSALTGGQFTNLSTSYASVKAIQFNNSGAIPVSATNIAWNWGAFNVFTGTTPISTAGYKLVSSTGCSSHTIDFTGWTGDWYETQPSFDVTTVISAVTCTISLSASTSAVSILSFDAVPFNAAIDLRWRTNAERDHMGFNVYRSDIYSVQFQQINKSLLRNLKSSGSNQASYRFIDQDVINGQKYYYYIEDVDTFGKKTLHGPVSATAMAGLGNPPVDNVNENSDTNPNDPINNGGTTSPAPIPNPSYEDLGNGIVILSKTSKSIRLEITPATPLFSTSLWNNTYEDVAISGYSKMTLVGSPELPEKDILIEVQSFALTAQVNNKTVTQNTLAGHLIAPAPNYSLNGAGVLVPNYSPNATRYGDSSFYPADYYSVQTDLVSTNQSKFLKIKINPLKLNPVTNTINMASKIVLDIGLNGDDWDVTPPDVNSEIGTYSVSNTLKINFDKTGVYQINFADFVSSGIEGPFINKDTSLWRLYFKNAELPLEIYSATGSFSPGDYIRFYVPFTKEIESKNNQLILSPVNITTVNTTPARIESVDADPTAQTVATDVLTKFTKTIEQNLTYIDGITLNDSLDHFFYASLVNFAGMDTLSVTTTLPEIDINNSENVLVKYYVRGRLGMTGNQIKHSVTLSIAGSLEGEIDFDENDRQVLTFQIPANHFISGNNTLLLKVLGTFAPLTDNDFVLVDKIEISYNGFKYGNTGVSAFSLTDAMKVHTITNFPSNQILGYDTTIPLNPKKLTNIGIASNDGGVTFDSKFFADGLVDDNNLKHFSFVSTPSIFKPKELSLNPGVVESLKNSTNHADLIIYGSENLIAAAQDLIDRRTSQGLDVMTVTPAQVYGEFSFGIQKSKALKDFMNTALNNWSKAPRFLLILGDGTFDPLDYNVSGLPANQRSVLEKGTLPAPLIAGRFIDFSSDNYFVSSDQSHLPRLSVGRLPTNDPSKIKVYVDKIKNYEDGPAAPTNYFKKVTFFADADTGNYEHFNQLSKAMMITADGFTSTLYDRTELGSLALTKSKINDEFNVGPLMISMLGHGAYDRFGDNIFNTSDAALLSNQILPIVVAWNCESAYFYDADNTYKSLGEELIFNPNGGAIVYMGSTTQTTPPAQSKLAQNFFSQLSSAIKVPVGETRFGDLIYHAKLGVGDGLYEKDIVNSFSIIGDPTLVLPSQLFPANAFTAPPVAKQKSLFGCSASAGDGTSKIPWHEGFLEWAFYMFLIVFGAKKAFRKSRV